MASIQDFLQSFLAIPTENPLQTFFLPLLLIFALIYGGLTVIRLFDKRINFVLAFVLTLFTTATPVFTWFSSLLPTYGAIAAVGAFVAIFFVGVLSITISRSREYVGRARYAGGVRMDRVEKLHKALEKLYKERQKAFDRDKMDKAKTIQKQIDDLENELKVLQQKRG